MFNGLGSNVHEGSDACAMDKRPFGAFVNTRWLVLWCLRRLFVSPFLIGGNGFFRVAAVLEADGPAQIHLPLPRDDARRRVAGRIQGRHLETAGGSAAPRLHPRPGSHRLGPATGNGSTRRPPPPPSGPSASRVVGFAPQVRVSFQSWSTVGGNSRTT